MRVIIAFRGLFLAASILLPLSGNSNIIGGGAGNELSYADALAVIIATEPIPADELPPVGMFYLASEGSNAAPLPGSLGLAAWDLGDGNYIVNDLDGITSSSASTSLRLSSQSGMSLMMNALDEPPSPGAGTNDGDTNFFSYTNHTNGLWLEANGLANGYLTGNLHNATNYVYALLSKTNLSQSGWTTEAELFPGANTISAPFSIPWLGRENVFLQAMDWSGVTHSGNTVPDWWLYYYFGANGLTTLTDSSTDSQGNTLVSDFQNNQDPNVISFYLSATNNRFSSSTAPVELDITAGTPNYYAVSIDDINYFSNASWQTYTGSNVSVGPMSEGWHNVWIGLRGLPANATPTWKGMRVKVDTTAPVLYVTNSIPDDIPVIQILGYSTKALSSLTYDIVNSDGALSNQPVAIVVQIYDTNNWEMTTSAFQAYDVELAAGGNTITLHAIDWAGHAASTQVEVTFDNSSKSAPSVIVLWPTNGMALCGSTFHCYGTVDDPTATVYVQQMMSDGTSSNVSGLVGRDGRFWVRDMTLEGTTNLVVTVTDAADNVVTTEVPVTQSTQLLSIDPVHPVQPGDTNVTVSASADAAVFVNGVAAAYDSTCQYWTAPIIPTGVAGGAILVKSGNTGFATIVDPASGIFMSSYQSNYYLTVSYYTNGYFIASTNHWDDKRGGASCGLEASCNWMWTIDWPTSSWPQTPPDGAMTSYSIPTGNQNGQSSAGWDNYFDSSMVFKDVDYTFPGVDSNWHCKEYVEKHYNLATGGLIGSTQKRIWQITASATAYKDDNDTEGYSIPATNIAIGSFGNLDTNGELWLQLSDNDPPPVTAKITGCNTVNRKVLTRMSTSTHTPAIVANEAALKDYTVASGAQFCVGQAIYFDIGGMPSTAILEKAEWTLNGTYVNRQPDTNCDAYFDLNTNLLTQTRKSDGTVGTLCWYVGGGSNLIVTVKISYQPSKSSALTHLTLTGMFNVLRPTATFVKYQDGTPLVQVTNGTMALGTVRNQDMSFQHSIVSLKFQGSAIYTQLVKGNHTTGNRIGPNNPELELVYIPSNQVPCDMALDNRDPAYLEQIPNMKTIQFRDNPYFGLYLSTGEASANLNFSTYLRFKPDDGPGPNIYVTLRRVDWVLNADVINNQVDRGNPVQDPQDHDVIAFPYWNETAHNVGLGNQ